MMGSKYHGACLFDCFVESWPVSGKFLFSFLGRETTPGEGRKGGGGAEGRRKCVVGKTLEEQGKI